MATVALAACGGVSGTYQDKYGDTLNFISGNADFNALGMTMEMDYKYDGKKILLQIAGSNQVVTRNEDESLETPWGHMTKK